MTTSVSPKLAESTAVNEAVKARMAPKQAAQAAPIDITANPVAKIVFNPEAAPEERGRQIAALLSPPTSRRNVRRRSGSSRPTRNISPSSAP